MHVKIVALISNLLIGSITLSRIQSTPVIANTLGGWGRGADLGSVIATVRNSGVREKKIVWEIFLTHFEKQNIPKFSVVIDLLIVFCEFYL